MSRRLFSRFALSVLSLLPALPLSSQTVWDSVNSGSWHDPANWSNGLPNGQAVVLSAYSLNLGVGGTPTITMSGGTASAFVLTVGYGKRDVAGPGAANLILTNGASLTSLLQSGISAGPNGFIGSTGSVTLENSSSWNTGSNFFIGQTGSGSLSILSGSTVTSVNSWIGYLSGSEGTVLVDGAASSWTTNTLSIGSTATGSLTVNNNALVTVANPFYLGEGTTGNLVLQNGGTLSVTSAVNNSIQLGFGANSRGYLTIGATGFNDPVAPGILDVDLITDTTSRAGGDSELIFNHNSSNYIFDTRITGYISLLHRKGTTILTADNDYYGVSSNGSFTTRIFDGRLQLGNGGTTGMITGPVEMERGTLAFNRSDDVTSGISVIDRSGLGYRIYLEHAGAGDLTLTGALAPTLTYRVTGGGDLFVTGPFSISGSLDYGDGIIEGPGRLIVTGDLGSTFTPVIRGGTLQLGNGGTTGNLSPSTALVSLSDAGNGATLAFNRSDDIAFGGIITGFGTMRKMGTNNLTLSGSLSVGGQFIIDGGQLIVTSDSTLSSHVSGDGTFVKDGATTLYAGGRFTQTGGTLVKNGTLSLLSSSGDTSTFTVESGATLRIGRNLAAPVTSAGTVTLSTNVTLSGPLALTGAFNMNTGTILTGGRDHSLGGPVDIAGTLSVRGNGRLTFTGDVSGTGFIRAEDDGTIRIGNGGTTGNLGVNIELVNSNTPLEINRSDDYVITSTISGGGYLVQAGTGKVTLQASPFDWGGTLRLRNGLLTYAANPTNQFGKIHFEGGTLQFHSGFTSDVSFRFSNNDNQAYRLHTNGQAITLATALTSIGGSLTKLGTGTLTLTGANTYTGGTFINGGTLLAGNASALRSGTINADYTLIAGGTLNLGGFALTMSSLAGTGGTVALSTATLTVDQAGDTAYAGVINGGGRLVKNGAGTLALTGTSSGFSGGTTINAGVLALQGNGSLGNASGTLTLNGGTLRTLSDIISARTVTLGNAGGTFDASGGYLTFNTGIANRSGETGSLTLANGLLTLNGAQTYTGATAVNNGSMLKLANGSLATSSVAIAQNATLLFNGTNTYAGGITGAGRVVAEFSNTTFAGAATHTGGTFIQSGRLQLGDGTTDGSIAGPVDLASGTIFAINRAGAGGVAPTLTGSGAFYKDGAGTLVLGDNSAFTGTFALTGGILSIDSNHALGLNNAGGALTITGGEIRAGGAPRTIQNAVTLSGNFRLGRLTNFSGNVSLTQNVTITSANPDVDPTARTSTFSGVISGNYGLTFAEGDNPIGAIVLSGANTYTGATSITGGKLVLSTANNRLPTSTTVYISNGATLDLGGFSQTVTSVGSAANRLNGAIANGTIATSSGNVFLQNGTYRNTFTGTHTGARIWIGGDTAATVLLDGVNDMVYTADHNQLIIGHSTTGAAGTVKVGNANALAAATEQVQIFDGTLDLNGQSGVRGESIAFMGGATSSLINSSGTTASFNQKVILNAGANARINGAGSVSFGGIVSGTGALTKTGSGTLTLSGNNTYSGGTALRGGTISLQHASGLGTGALTFDGGTLIGGGNLIVSLAGSFDAGGATIHASSGFFTVDGTFSGAGALTKTGSSMLTFNSHQTYTGATTINGGNIKFAGNVASASIAVAAGSKALFVNSQTYAGAITGAGVLEHESGGITTLTGNATHTGGTNIVGGNIQVGNGGTTGTLGGNVVLSNSGTLTFNRSDASVFSGQITGAGTLVKTGDGTLTLNGTHTFTGATTISRGTLHLNGSLANSTVTVGSGARLGGSGTLAALTLASGGTLTPGNSPGTLTVTGNALWEAGSTYLWEINDATGDAGLATDLVSISGTLTLNATSASKLTLSLVSLLAGNSAGDVINFDAEQNYAYTIARANGGIFGFDASAFTINASGFTNSLHGGTWSLALSNSNRDLTLNFTAAAIPEPSTYAMIFGALVLALAIHRKRQRSL